jgi:hypothetical protein
MPIDNPQHVRDGFSGETTPVSARDSATGVVVPNVGDDANKAIRVNVVAGGGGGGGTVTQGPSGNPNDPWNVDVTEDGTNTVVKPGDATNKAIRVNVVAGGGGGTQYADGTVFVVNTSIGTLGLAVVDDGSIAVPAVGDMTAPRLTSAGAALLVGGRGGGPIGGSMPFHVDDPGGTGFGTLYVQPDPNANAFSVIGMNVVDVTSASLGKQDTQAYVPGDDRGVMGLAVVDDGTITVPAVGAFTPPRIDPLTRGLIAGPKVTDAVVGTEAGVITLVKAANGATWRALQLGAAGGLLVDIAASVTVPISIDAAQVVGLRGISEQVTGFTANGITGLTSTVKGQNKLSVCITANGTVTTATLTVQVVDEFNNKSASVIVLTAADLNVLKPVVVTGPFAYVFATLTGLTFGTATTITLSVTATP